jgi:hypothetical protein
MSVTKYIVISSLPYVESKEFQSFVANFHPQAIVNDVVPTSKFTRSKLPRLFDSMKKEIDSELVKDLASCYGVAFSTEINILGCNFSDRLVYSI